MDGWGVGTAIFFLVGNGCWCCWCVDRWVGGGDGGSVGGNFGVTPCFILYW